jgi:itaconyl-CoA hydratase
MTDEVAELKASAKFMAKGRMFDEFEVGEVIHHHWGRTITEADAIQFTHLTLSYNPLYFNREYAREHGHCDLVVNPQLVFNTILGLSVEDNSEGLAGPFLGVNELAYHEPVYPGDTLTAISTVTHKRESESRPGKQGIVGWHTKGFNQNVACVVEFKRSNLSNFAGAQKMREGALG